MNTGAPAPAGRCPRCGGAQAGGLCPRCLLAAALEPEDDTGADVFADADEAGRQAPRRIGGYQLLGEIARGGAGIVYRAWQGDLKREVALKMLLWGRLESRVARDRFQREAQLMASLDHPGILPVHEVGLHADAPWFSMKLAEGGNLAERAARLHGGHADIARLLAQVARAVEHAHRRGVLHRDLKPSNIVFDRDGNPLVTDFGLARRLQVDSTLTGLDAVIGTPRYVAPEVLTRPAAQLTAAVDIYGLGAILYELLCGEAPFAELTPLEILQQVATRQPRHPREFDTSIAPALEAICLRCLEKRPEDRYRSALALADALEAWVAGARPPLLARLRGMKLALPSRRRRAGLATGVVLVLGLALVMTWQLLREPIPTPDPALAARSVAVLPNGLDVATPGERETARQLAAHLELQAPLRLLPFDATLTIAAAAKSPHDIDATLGAFLFVIVVRLPDEQGFRAVAFDDLREERLFQTRFRSEDVPGVARDLARALHERREHAVAEAALPRSALASLLHAIGWLRYPVEGTNLNAIAALKDAVQEAPDSALAHAWLAYAYLNHGGAAFWVDSAIEEAARAQRMDPALGLAQRMLGLAYFRKGWLARALTAHEQSRTLGSLWVDTELADVYYLTGRFEDSFRTFRDDEPFAPDDQRIRTGIAHLLLTVGESDAGERLMRMAMARQPSALVRTMLEAEIAWYRQDAAKCRELVAGVPAENGGWYFSAPGLLQDCAARQGDFAAALASVIAERQKYADTPESSSANNPMVREAIVLAQLGREAELQPLLAGARQSLQAALDGGNEHPRVWLRMAAVQRLAGETVAAYATLERAFALGLTVNNGNRDALEFLPFQRDVRFQAMRADSEAQVAQQRAKIASQLSPALREPIRSAPESGSERVHADASLVLASAADSQRL